MPSARQVVPRTSVTVHARGCGHTMRANSGAAWHWDFDAALYYGRPGRSLSNVDACIRTNDGEFGAGASRGSEVHAAAEVEEASSLGLRVAVRALELFGKPEGETPHRHAIIDLCAIAGGEVCCGKGLSYGLFRRQKRRLVALVDCLGRIHNCGRSTSTEVYGEKRELGMASVRAIENI